MGPRNTARSGARAGDRLSVIARLCARVRVPSGLPQAACYDVGDEHDGVREHGGEEQRDDEAQRVHIRGSRQGLCQPGKDKQRRKGDGGVSPSGWQIGSQRSGILMRPSLVGSRRRARSNHPLRDVNRTADASRFHRVCRAGLGWHVLRPDVRSQVVHRPQFDVGKVAPPPFEVLRLGGHERDSFAVSDGEDQRILDVPWVAAGEARRRPASSPEDHDVEPQRDVLHTPPLDGVVTVAIEE